MSAKIELVKQYKDGGKVLQYNKVQFSISPQTRTVILMSDWTQARSLVQEGVFVEHFYRQLYGHTEYKLKDDLFIP